jgi:hypothetical protein
MSDSRNMLMTDFQHVSNGGAIAQAGCRRFGSGAWPMTVGPHLRFFGSGNLVVRIDLSCWAWSRCMASCRMSKLSSSIADDKVDSPGSSLSSLLISQSISPLSCSMGILARALAISNTILEGWDRYSTI